MRINGKRVVDAKSPLRITITPKDAALGRNKDPAACAAARAILRGYKEEGVKSARVHLGRVYVEHDDKWIRYVTPEVLRTEIISFDRHKSTEFMPGDYTLRAISAANRLGTRRGPQQSGTPGNKRKKIARIVHHVEGVRAHGANK